MATRHESTNPRRDFSRSLDDGQIDIEDYIDAQEELEEEGFIEEEED